MQLFIREKIRQANRIFLSAKLAITVYYVRSLALCVASFVYFSSTNDAKRDRDAGKEKNIKGKYEPKANAGSFYWLWLHSWMVIGQLLVGLIIGFVIYRLIVR